jgi:hypothetical protein
VLLPNKSSIEKEKKKRILHLEEGQYRIGRGHVLEKNTLAPV